MLLTGIEQSCWLFYRVLRQFSDLFWTAPNGFSLQERLECDKFWQRPETPRVFFDFNHSLCGNVHIIHIIRISVKPNKGLVALKAMSVARMSQKILVIFYQTLVLSAINYMYGIVWLWCFSNMISHLRGRLGEGQKFSKKMGGTLYKKS